MGKKTPKTVYWLWALGLGGIGATAVATILDPPTFTGDMAIPVIVIAVAAFFSGVYQIRVSSLGVFSLCAAAFAGGTLAFGPVIGAWLAGGVDLLITVADERRVKRGLAAPAPPDVAPGRVIANTGLNAAMFLAGGYAYEAVAGSAPLGRITWLTLGGVAAFVAARLVVNYFFIFTVQSVRGSRPTLRRIPVETRNATAFDLALLPAAVVFSLLYARGMTWGLILAGASLVLASILLQRENRLDLVVKRYVSHAKSSKILANPYELLRAERRDISIVFADLRGTTGISQRLAPAKMLTLLNDFHGAMIDEVIRAGATVDKILGDGLMVLVGAPVREEHHAAKAVHLGIMMHRAYRGVRRGLDEKGLPGPGMGVGISSGEVVIGNVGSEMRLDYTAIGLEVNVASKLCAAAADGEILVSGECRLRAEESRAAGHAPYLTDLSFEDGRSIDVPGLEEPLKSTRVIYA